MLCNVCLPLGLIPGSQRTKVCFRSSLHPSTAHGAWDRASFQSVLLRSIEMLLRGGGLGQEGLPGKVLCEQGFRTGLKAWGRDARGHDSPRDGSTLHLPVGVSLWKSTSELKPNKKVN